MKTYYLISVNFRGGVSYMASGARRAMEKRAIHSYHVVTTISDPAKAARKYGTGA